MLDGTPYTTNLDDDRLLRIKDHFATVRPRYTQFMSAITGVETEIFKSQIPGGMISNMESQLRQQGAGDRLKEVLEEVPRVREVAGYPPLVTPSSQIVGTQAVFNVLMGPYKVLTAEFADLMLGYYGATLGERDPEIVEAARAQTKKEPITVRPADLLAARVGAAAAGGQRPRGRRRHRRGRPDLRDVPGRGARLLRQPARGPAERRPRPGRGGGRASRPSRPGKGPVKGPIKYAVTMDGSPAPRHRRESVRRTMTKATVHGRAHRRAPGAARRHRAGRRRRRGRTSSAPRAS